MSREEKKYRQSFYWWFKLEGRFIPRNIIIGIKNLIKWFPIIFKDRDWDSYYILEVLKFKIKNTAKYISDSNRYVGCERDVEIMNTVVRLIEKVQNETYSMEYMDHETGEFSLENFLEYRNSQDYSKYFEKYPLIYKYVSKTPKQKDVFNNDYDNSIVLSMGMVNHQRAKKLLFKLLNEHIEKWWD